MAPLSHHSKRRSNQGRGAPGEMNQKSIRSDKVHLGLKYNKSHMTSSFSLSVAKEMSLAVFEGRVKRLEIIWELG